VTPTKRRSGRLLKMPDPDIADQVAKLPDTMLACRDIQHAWAVDVPFYRQRVKGEPRNTMQVTRTVVCMRCETQRVEHYRISKRPDGRLVRMEKISNHYVYPDAYHLRGAGKQAEVRSVVRIEQINRALGGLS